MSNIFLPATNIIGYRVAVLLMIDRNLDACSIGGQPQFVENACLLEQQGLCPDEGLRQGGCSFLVGFALCIGFILEQRYVDGNIHIVEDN